MSKLLRHFGPGQYCFVTVVTADRRCILDQHARMLVRALRRAARRSRFELVAWVILPDHVHAILCSPDGDIPRVVQRVKLSFSLQWLRHSHAQGPVWQHRYWDHIIRSDDDMRRHVDYIHINPVKHGLAHSPREWPLTSFHRYLRSGMYDPDWGGLSKDLGQNEFGE